MIQMYEETSKSKIETNWTVETRDELLFFIFTLNRDSTVVEVKESFAGFCAEKKDCSRPAR
jgi:hypothetical protein